MDHIKGVVGASQFAQDLWIDAALGSMRGGLVVESGAFRSMAKVSATACSSRWAEAVSAGRGQSNLAGSDRGGTPAVPPAQGRPLNDKDLLKSAIYWINT